MASGTGGRGSGTPNSAAMMVSALQEMNVRLRRMESRQNQLQTAMEELKDLMKEQHEATFKVKGSKFQVKLICLVLCMHLSSNMNALHVASSVTQKFSFLFIKKPLECKVAVLFSQDIVRQVSDEELRVSVRLIMHTSTAGHG